ncbi:hypothetical protein CPC08DRAFT_67370 [Agrocybe pediades]|nr:hypothetical protein CPC08DRAFT_67370 [Agrocybe pediades]
MVLICKLPYRCHRNIGDYRNNMSIIFLRPANDQTFHRKSNSSISRWLWHTSNFRSTCTRSLFHLSLLAFCDVIIFAGDERSLNYPSASPHGRQCFALFSSVQNASLNSCPSALWSNGAIRQSLKCAVCTT